MHTTACMQTGKTRRHVEQIMSDTTTPQLGAGSKPAGQLSGAQQQQGQQPVATPPQQQSGTVIRGPIFKDWASI